MIVSLSQDVFVNRTAENCVNKKFKFQSFVKSKLVFNQPLQTGARGSVDDTSPPQGQKFNQSPTR
jgi:hypothetical protein